MGAVIDPAAIRTRAEFSAGLTALRESAGFTVRDLAKRIGRPSGTLGDHLSGRHLPSPGQQTLIVDVLQACGVEDPIEVEAWLGALRRVRASSDRRTTRSAAPYRGLKPFEPEDAALFFGRRDQTDDIVQRVGRLRTGTGPRILPVIGPSGSGKSSVLRAGVVAAVRAGALDGDDRWTCTITTPGDDPASAFAAAMAQRGDGPHLVVLDQFEEIFTLITEPAVRTTFLDVLAGAGPDAVVVLGMRADFFADAAREPVLLTALRHDQVVIGPMSTEQVREAVVGPAAQIGASVEEGLADVVLADLAPQDAAAGAHDAGSLPLLSHALLAAWERSNGRRLTIADYRATGGLDAAVQRTAEEVFTGLDAEQQEVAHDLFLRLVTIGDDVAPTRRRISRDELGFDVDGDDRAEVVARFVERRLLTLNAATVEVSHEALLTAWPRLRAWLDTDRAGLLVHRRITVVANAWNDTGNNPAALFSGVALQTAAEWAAEPRNRRRMNGVEHAFVDAGLRRRDQLARAERRRTRRLVQLLVAVAVLALVASGLAIVARVAQDSANHERRAASAARDDALSRQVAIQARELSASDPGLAQQLAVAGYRIAHTVESRSELLDTAAAPVITRVLGAPGPTPLAVSALGVEAVGHADDGSVHLLAVHGGRVTALGVVPGAKQQQFALAFSPDGRVLATGGAPRDVRLWDVHDPAHPRALSRLPTGFPDDLQSLAFSPDSHRLLGAGDGPHPIHAWDVVDPAHVTSLTPPAGVPGGSTVQAVAFDAAGTAFAAATAGGRLLYWGPGARTPRTAAVSPTGSVGLNAVAFAPHSRLLVTGARDGRVTLWNTAGTGLPVVRTLPGNSDGQVNVLAFSADGARMLSGSSDNSVRQWATASWTVTDTTAEPGPVTGVGFSADGSSVFTTAADGALRRWSADGPDALVGSGTAFSLSWSGNGTLLAVGQNGVRGGVQLWNARHPRGLRPIGPLLTVPGTDAVDGTSAISRNGRLVAAGTGGGRVALWKTDDPAHPTPAGAPFAASTRLIEAVVLSPDGSLLAVGGDDDNVSLWSVRDPAHPTRLARLRTANLVLNVAFSPDGRLLAAADADKTAHLWDVATPAAPRRTAVLGGFGSYVYGVAFSPDGRLLAAASADHTTRLWSITDPARPVRQGAALRGPTDYENIPSFDATGHLLAVPSNDHTVWVYDVSRPAHARVLSTLRAVQGNVFAAAFGPVGRLLVAGGRFPVVPVWSVDPTSDAALVCAGAGSPITRTEWRQYVPGAPYHPPCR